MEKISIYTNNGFSEFLWSNSLKISTIVVTIILLGCFLLMIKAIWSGNGTVVHYVCFALLLVGTILPVFVSPRKVTVDKDGICVRLIGTSIPIPVEKIEKVEAFSNRDGLIRTCGVGGFFGYTLYFRAKSIGKFVAYVTDWSQSYVIYRKDEKPIVVSVQDPTIFKPFMKDVDQ